MKPLTDIITEAQALATIGEDQFEASLATLVADLQALEAGTPTPTPTADPVVTVTTTTQSGVTAVFVPQVTA